MRIEIGTNPNCSESVHQVCGVTKPIAEKMKERFKEILSKKYSKKYLDEYTDETFAFWGTYCLTLFDYEGHENPDWGVINLVAEEMGLDISWVSSCSNPIDTDENMAEHMKWMEEKKLEEDWDK